MDIDPTLLEHRTVLIADRQHPDSRIVQEQCRATSDLAEALYCRGRPYGVDLQRLSRPPA
jgi:hypothetical protein